MLEGSEATSSCGSRCAPRLCQKPGVCIIHGRVRRAGHRWISLTNSAVAAARGRPPIARQVLRALRKIHEVDVIGLSWGGLLAQQMALTSAEKGPRLVAGLDEHGGAACRGWRCRGAPGQPVPVQRGEEHAGRPERFGGVMRPPRRGAAESKRGKLAQTPRDAGLLQTAGGLLGWSACSWLPLIRQPTLVVCGSGRIRPTWYR